MKTTNKNTTRQNVNVNFANVIRAYKDDARTLNRLFRDLTGQAETCEDTRKVLGIICKGCKNNNEKKNAFVAFCKKYTKYNNDNGQICKMRKVAGYKEIQRAYIKEAFTFADFRSAWLLWLKDVNDAYQPAKIVFTTFYSAKGLPMSAEHALNIHRMIQKELRHKRALTKDTRAEIATLQTRIKELQDTLL